MGRKWSEIAWCGGWLFTELHKPPSVNGLELSCSMRLAVRGPTFSNQHVGVPSARSGTTAASNPLAGRRRAVSNHGRCRSATTSRLDLKSSKKTRWT